MTAEKQREEKQSTHRKFLETTADAGVALWIHAGLSPNGSVYFTVNHGDVDVSAGDLQLP